MFAAVVSPAGRVAVEQTLSRVGGRRGEASHVLCAPVSGGCAAIASWSTVARQRVDADAARVVEGDLEGDVAGPFAGAFALAELGAAGLTLARGRLGGRPLYVTRSGADWIACTDLAALSGALLPKASLDPNRLAALAISRWGHAPDATVQRGVHQLVSGQVVRLGARGERASSVAPEPSLATIDGDVDTLAEELRCELFATVARATDGHARVALLAGGGLDSSGLLAAAVALARGASHREVTALTLDFAGEGDDRPYMRALAHALGIVPIRFSPRAFGPLVRDALVIGGGPYPWPTGAWELGLARAAKEHGASVILSGTGGDDVLDGDPAWMAARLAQGDLRVVRDALALRLPWSMSWRARLWRFLARPIALRAMPLRVRDLARRARQRPIPWAGPVLKRILREEDVASISPLAPTPGEFFRWLSRAPAMLQYAEIRALFETELGCAVADPYLDERFVRFAARLPRAASFHDDRSRGLYRLALRGLVPDSVRLRPDKAAFQSAGDEMLRETGALEGLRDLIDMRVLDALGIVDGRAYARAFEDLAAKVTEDSLDLWPPLALEAFARGAA